MKKMGRVRLETEAPQILGPGAHVEASHSSVAKAVQWPHSSRVLFKCSCARLFQAYSQPLCFYAVHGWVQWKSDSNHKHANIACG